MNVLTGYYINPETRETRRRDLTLYRDAFQKLLKSKQVKYTRLWVDGKAFVAAYNDSELEDNPAALSSAVYKNANGLHFAHLYGRLFLFKAFLAPNEPGSLSAADIETISTRVIYVRTGKSAKVHKALLID